MWPRTRRSNASSSPTTCSSSSTWSSAGCPRARAPRRPSELVGWGAVLPAARSLARRRSLILAYHGVGESNAEADPEFLRVPPAAFRGQLDVLTPAGSRVSAVAPLAPAARAAGGTPPPGLVALSFDDGMEDNHSELLPI